MTTNDGRRAPGKGPRRGGPAAGAARGRSRGGTAHGGLRRASRQGASPSVGQLPDGLTASAPRAGCPSCPAFGRCGGCQQLDVPYADQLAAKQREIEELFAPLAPAAAFAPILGMDDPFCYRNKVISPYAPAPRRKGKGPAQRGKAGRASRRAEGGGSAARDNGRAGQPDRPAILTGMYERGTHRLIPTDDCLIENALAKRATLTIRDIMARHGMEPYDEDAHAGFVRHAVVRAAQRTGELLVTLVTNGREFAASKAFCRELKRRVPQVTTVVQNVNTRQTNAILGTEERVLYGPGFILDELCGLTFRISSQSFYQVNAAQAETLYDVAISLAGLDGTQAVLDAYCGTGTIGLVAATRGAAQVIGVDSVASAIADARLNARHNGIANARFVAADATDFMEGLAGGGALSQAWAPQGAEGADVAGPSAVAEPDGEGSGALASEGEAGAGARWAPDGKAPGTLLLEDAADGATAPAVATAPEGPADSAAAASPGELVLLMDPPRAGATERFLAAAAALAPARIVYVSCNPATQARDARTLAAHGYRITRVQPVDMFPYTPHIENICLFERRPGCSA